MVLPGIDHIGSLTSRLKTARVGLMTNPTGLDSKHRSSIDIIHENYRLGALLACEHGVRGCVTAGDSISTFTDPATDVTVYSCYGASTHICPEALERFDVFIYDIQDAGARFYTYIYSLANAMEDCAKAGKPVVVLDRPAPLGGLTVQGTLLDEAVSSFVGRFSIPTRYALTAGEFALWVRDHLKLDLDLNVVPMTGWTRAMRYEDTGLLFVPPSPNLSTLHALKIYPGTCIFEGSNISEGRGTALPFELIGAPFIDAGTLAQHMNAFDLPGFYFREAYFTPSCSKHSGQQCGGVQIYLTDERLADATLMGLVLMETIRDMYPDSFCFTGSLDRLLGTSGFREGKYTARGLIAAHQTPISDWYEHARPYMLY